MQWTSIIAIYALLWVFSAFLVLPFGVRTHAEDGVDTIPGQADSAPSRFRPGRIVLRTTVVSAALFALFYLNYVNDWVEVDDLNFFGSPPGYVDRY